MLHNYYLTLSYSDLSIKLFRDQRPAHTKNYTNNMYGSRWCFYILEEFCNFHKFILTKSGLVSKSDSVLMLRPVRPARAQITAVLRRYYKMAGITFHMKNAMDLSIAFEKSFFEETCKLP